MVSKCIIFVPKNKMALYYNRYTGEPFKFTQGKHFSRFFLKEFVPWNNNFQESFTNLVDLRSYADPISRYQILTQSQLKLTITGKAIVKIVDPIKAYTSTNDLDMTIDSLCKAELRNHFSKLTAKEIIQQQDLLEEDLTAALNKDLTDYGTIVEKFIISHVNLPSALTNAVERTTAQETEHRCKLLEIDNQRKLAEEKLKIRRMNEEADLACKNMKDLAELEYQEKSFKLNKLKESLQYEARIEFLDQLKKREVDLTEYLKYENLKKTNLAILTDSERHNFNVHVTPNETKKIKEIKKDLETNKS